VTCITGQCEIGFLQDGRVILRWRSLTALSRQSRGARCRSMAGTSGVGALMAYHTALRTWPPRQNRPQLVVKSYLRAREARQRRASENQASLAAGLSARSRRLPPSL
jgi:hypothetical protein